MEEKSSFYGMYMTELGNFIDSHPGLGAIIEYLAGSPGVEEVKPEEIYVDAKMLDQGLTLELFKNENYLRRVRRMQIAQLEARDWITINNICIAVPKTPSVEMGDNLVTVEMDGDLVVVGVEQGDEEAVGVPQETQISFPDRVEHDDRLMGWLSFQAYDGFRMRLSASLRQPCICGGDGLMGGEMSSLNDAQSDMIGAHSTNFVSRDYRGACLCCTRHWYFKSLFNDYVSFSPKVRELLWLLEERLVAIDSVKHLDPQKTLIYRSGNPVKMRMMQDYCSVIAPKTMLALEESRDVEIQGTFIEIATHKAANSGIDYLVDDAGFMDEQGCPGPYAKMLYPKMGAEGMCKAVVVMTMTFVDHTDVDGWKQFVHGVGVQTFEAGPPDKEGYGDWRDIVYPVGITSGPIRCLPSLLREWSCARFRALRSIFRQRGWLF